MSASDIVKKSIIWMLIVLNYTQCNPIQSDDEGYLIESRLNNYRKRFTMIAERIDEKYNADLQSLIEQFNAVFNSHDVKNEALLMENYNTQLDPEFAEYLQNQLDLQLLNQDINMEKWFLEQLIQQVDNPELKEDIKLFMPLYEKARQTIQIDEKFEYFASIETEIPQRVLDFLQTDPVEISVLNVQLQYFREFLLYLLQECMVDAFENDIKSILDEVELALKSDASYQKKLKLIDAFDSVETDFERFLDAKAHEFELYKFGLQ